MTLVNGAYLLSNSEVQTHQRCPREWWLGWHRGLKPRTETLAGVRSTGSRLHIALAELYTPGDGNPRAALLDAQNEDLHTLSIQSIYVSDDDDERKLDETEGDLLKAFDLERIMLDGYLEWIAETGADEHLEVIAAETYVEAPILIDDEVSREVYGVPVRLIGKIDARVRNLLTGRLMFIDHKTGNFPRRQSLKINPQMKHYHLIELLSAPDDVSVRDLCDGAIWNTLRRVKRTRTSKPPYYQRDIVDHNQYETTSYHVQLQAAAGKILRTIEEVETRGAGPATVPPQFSRYCEWGCAFYKICPMFDDGSRVEAAVENLYTVDDPLGYYGGQEKGSEITED